jgi:hypothetical protein
MQEFGAEDNSSEDSHRELRFFVAVTWGMLMGGLTFAAGPISALSVNSLIASIQWALTALLTPGLVCAAIVGSLGPAAAINALFHFCVGWLLLALVARLKRKVRTRR